MGYNEAIPAQQAAQAGSPYSGLSNSPTYGVQGISSMNANTPIGMMTAPQSNVAMAAQAANIPQAAPQPAPQPPKKRGFFGSICQMLKPSNIVRVVTGAVKSVVKTVVDTITDPKKLLLAALLIGASIMFPGIGTALVIGGLAMAAVNGGLSMKNAYTAYKNGDDAGGDQIMSDGVGAAVGDAAMAAAGSRGLIKGRIVPKEFAVKAKFAHKAKVNGVKQEFQKGETIKTVKYEDGYRDPNAGIGKKVWYAGRDSVKSTGHVVRYGWHRAGDFVTNPRQAFTANSANPGVISSVWNARQGGVSSAWGAGKQAFLNKRAATRAEIASVNDEAMVSRMEMPGFVPRPSSLKDVNFNLNKADLMAIAKAENKGKITVTKNGETKEISVSPAEAQQMLRSEGYFPSNPGAKAADQTWSKGTGRNSEEVLANRASAAKTERDNLKTKVDNDTATDAEKADFAAWQREVDAYDGAISPRAQLYNNEHARLDAAIKAKETARDKTPDGMTNQTQIDARAQKFNDEIAVLKADKDKLDAVDSAGNPIVTPANVKARALEIKTLQDKQELQTLINNNSAKNWDAIDPAVKTKINELVQSTGGGRSASAGEIYFTTNKSRSGNIFTDAEKAKLAELTAGKSALAKPDIQRERLPGLVSANLSNNSGSDKLQQNLVQAMYGDMMYNGGLPGMGGSPMQWQNVASGDAYIRANDLSLFGNQSRLQMPGQNNYA